MHLPGNIRQEKVLLQIRSHKILYIFHKNRIPVLFLLQLLHRFLHGAENDIIILRP